MGALGPKQILSVTPVIGASVARGASSQPETTKVELHGAVLCDTPENAVLCVAGRCAR